MAGLSHILHMQTGAFKQGSCWYKAKRLVTLALILILLYQLYLLFWVLFYSVFNPSSSAVMREQARQLSKLSPAQEIRYQWVDHEQISPTIKRAVMAAEDANFLQHSGVEWSSMWQAYQYNLAQQAKGKSNRRGGSTISQQVAKNLFLSNDRNYLRKGQELVITYMLETFMSKQRILELYLNIAQFSPQSFGVEAASQQYYKKSAKDLSNVQAAKLAALLPNPIQYSRNLNSRFMNSRSNTILQRMPLVSPP